MGNSKFVQKTLWAIGAMITVVAFNNCGEGFTTMNLGSISGGSVEFSTSGGETCEEAIVKVYASTFHPFLSQTCGGCHVPDGIGLGVFGSSDVKASYVSFASVGAAKISAQAVNAAHKPPYTGSQNQARINEINGYWSTAQDKYADCLVENGSAPAVSWKAKSSMMAIPAAAYTTTNFQTVTFDLALGQPANPLTATIEVRRSVVSGAIVGYEFRNPSLRLKNVSSGSYEVKNIGLIVNGILAEEATTYQNVSAVIATTTSTNLSPGTANAIFATTPVSGDRIGLQFEVLKSTTATAPSPTPTATATASPSATPTTMTYTQLAATGGVFAQNCFSCHRTGYSLGGLNLQDYAQARAAAGNIRSRMNGVGGVMPTSGMLGEYPRALVDVWINTGTPQ
ncbi:hypothetical protein [Bdellovibrio sp. HCB209]|uniref:hypothetical protein n=1 Tax=Bdellovibrio sp. HCB209 TaxID=3394354 RepID=UPI0039B5F9B4